MSGCPYCSVNSAGTHEVNCPNYSKPKSSLDIFLDKLNSDTIEIRPGPAQVLIGQYIELLSAYGMTMDAIELAGEQLGIEKLKKVSLYIEKALQEKINEIVALQEIL